MRDGGHQAGLGLAALALKFWRDGPHLQRRGGINNRPVTGAAAQIAGKGGVDFSRCQPLAITPGGEQRHDKAGGAEAALRSVMVNHHLLAGMQRAIRQAVATRTGILQPLDGCHRRTFKHAHELDTGIDRVPAHAGVSLPARHHNRAGAAIALAAAFLRPGQPLCLPQPVEKRRVTGEAADLLDLVVENECNPVAHRLISPGPASASAIGRIAIGRQQQRHMIMLVRPVDPEGNDNLIKKRHGGKPDPAGAKIGTGVKHQLITPASEIAPLKKRSVDPAIIIRCHRGDQPA